MKFTTPVESMIEIDLKFWILESAIYSKMSKRIAADENAYRRSQNRTFHGCSEERFSDELNEMIKQGLLYKESTAPHSNDGPGAVSDFNYSLTPTGAKMFEALSVPCWESFVAQNWGTGIGDGCQRVVLSGLKRQEIDAYCTYLQGITWVALEVEEKVLRPFAPTYWKELPAGLEVVFDFEPVDPVQVYNNLLNVGNNSLLPPRTWRKFGYNGSEAEQEYGESDDGA